MIENVVRTIGGVEAFGIISISIFFLFFTGMQFWAFRLKKTYLNSMSGLPLHDDATAEKEAEPDSQKLS